MAWKWNQDDFQKASSDEFPQGKTENTVPHEDVKKDKTASFEEAAEHLFKGKKGREVKDEKSAKRAKRFFGRTGILLLIAVLVIVLLNGIYIVPEGKIAFVTQFGKIMSTTTEAGLHVHVPFIQKASYLTNKVMVYDVSPSEVLTADKKAMIVDSYALWKIQDVTRFIRTVGNIGELQKRIDATVYSNIKNIMGGLQQNEIISDEETARDSLNKQVTERAADELKSYGVEVLRVEIRRYDLPADNLDAVYKRMISERRQMAASYKAEGELQAAKIRNNTDKDYIITVGEAEAAAKRIEGEAEKEYMAILEELYGKKDQAEFYKFMLELDALKQSLQGEKTVIVGPDSVLGKIIKGEAEGVNPD